MSDNQFEEMDDSLLQQLVIHSPLNGSLIHNSNWHPVWHSRIGGEDDLPRS